LISGDLIVMNQASVIEAALAGQASFDQLIVQGAVTLDNEATLLVNLENFAPMANDSFAIITSTGGITGTFSDPILPDPGEGLEWSIQYGNDVALLVQMMP
jgi:hypothetical protein